MIGGETEAGERRLIAQTCAPRQQGKGTESRSPYLVLRVLGPWLP